MTTTTHVLVAEDLRKSYGERVAVDGVGFSIGPSETYGLLGPNGAGKTTTISMICGLLVRDAGSVMVDGRPIDVGQASAKGAIGYVPQDLAIYPELTARENLRFFGQLYGISGRELSTRIGEVLEIIGLTDRANDKTDEYSGGMKRRLNIGIGLLHRPKLLVLDEPTVGVDPQSRNAILSSVEALGEQGMAILYTTHYMEEAERLCDRVGIIDEGRIRAEGTRGGRGRGHALGAIASNAEQAAGVGVFAGLGIAAIGGAMAPPEIFPPIMDAISRLTPHRWAIEGLREVTVGGGISDTLPQLGVLSAFAIVLLGLAAWRLRLALTR